MSREYEYNFIKLLIDKRLVDSYQFFKTCSYKLQSAKISLEALKRLISEYIENEQNYINDVFETAIKTGKSSYIRSGDSVDFFGESVPRIFAIDKLTIEIFSILHSFFDTYAQWLNAVLFGANALPIKQVSLNSVINKMGDFPEYSGQFIADLNNILNQDDYKYISDINNIVKHRHQIYTKSSVDLFSGVSGVTLPQIHKDANSHPKTELLSVTDSCWKYCDLLLRDSYDYINQYFLTNDNKYVANRVYNPKTYMQFDNKEDYEHFKNCRVLYYYIEVNLATKQSEYQILLYRDNPEDKSWELVNSIYPLIAIKDEAETTSGKYIGVLKPSDSIAYSFDDGRLLIYRKYDAMYSNFEAELMNVFINKNYHYYPLLSDATATILNGE